MKNAFILGAGLGNRLRPLTDRLPKPLVPLFHRPLAEWAMDACAAVGITRFAINTHHLPATWKNFGNLHDLTFFHEPILLETGGGLKNISPWLGSDSLLVHNGDIFSTLPLAQLIAAHEASGLPVTLAVRSEGTARHITLDASLTRVNDIRNSLGRGLGTHTFTGIYCVNSDFLERIPPREKISVIPAFLALAQSGQLGAIVLDDGIWLDLGNRDSYLKAHLELDLGPAIHPLANIAPDANIVRSVIGPGAIVESGATVRDSVLWPYAQVSSNSTLERCIVYSQAPASGCLQDCDI